VRLEKSGSLYLGPKSPGPGSHCQGCFVVQYEYSVTLVDIEVAVEDSNIQTGVWERRDGRTVAVS